MILENNSLKGTQSELGHLDEVMDKLGFVRWQWEYTRATYDCKFEDQATNEEYYLRLNTRAVQGKLEDPLAVLQIEDTYIGLATFPHGLDYAAPIPGAVLKAAEQKLAQLEQQLH